MSNPLDFEYFKPIATHPTDWDPSTLQVPINCRLDGCIVPSESQGARISYSHVIVLDGLVEDSMCKEMREFLAGKNVAAPHDSRGTGNAEELHSAVQEERSGVFELPEEKWERRTADMAGAAPTWGLKPHMLAALAAGEPAALIEVQSRLQLLYSECVIAHLPSNAIQNSAESLEDDMEPAAKRSKNSSASVEPTAQSPAPIARTPGAADCSAFLANAAAEGDTFRFHVDADPTSFPDNCPWTRYFGDYFNGEPGKPLLVTLLVYLDEAWERDWGGETLFLDSATDAGIFVRPRAGRAVLMEQDVLHRVSPPSSVAHGRMRLSLVWKLAFIPRRSGQEASLVRKEWSVPSNFGSAARVEAVKRQLAQERESTRDP